MSVKMKELSVCIFSKLCFLLTYTIAFLDLFLSLLQLSFNIFRVIIKIAIVLNNFIFIIDIIIISNNS